jgi:YHS domain-containing protein
MMTAPLTLLLATLAAAPPPPQHQAHDMGGLAAPAPNPACADAGQKARAIVEAAGHEPETARSPSTGDLRRTMADLQAVVAAAQAELFICRAAVVTPLAAAPAAPMAGMDHSAMTPGPPAPGSPSAKPGAKPADPMAGMDHSKMDRGKPATAKPANPMAAMDHSKMDMGKPAAKPAPSAAKVAAPPTPSATEAPIEAGGGKLPVAMAERVADPACPDNLGQATAPKAVYERKVYYFCSTKDRDAFRKDPAAYLKKRPR